MADDAPHGIAFVRENFFHMTNISPGKLVKDAKGVMSRTFEATTPVSGVPWCTSSRILKNEKGELSK